MVRFLTVLLILIAFFVAMQFYYPRYEFHFNKVWEGPIIYKLNKASGDVFFYRLGQDQPHLWTKLPDTKTEVLIFKEPGPDASKE